MFDYRERGGPSFRFVLRCGTACSWPSCSCSNTSKHNIRYSYFAFLFSAHHVKTTKTTTKSGRQCKHLSPSNSLLRLFVCMFWRLIQARLSNYSQTHAFAIEAPKGRTILCLRAARDSYESHRCGGKVDTIVDLVTIANSSPHRCSPTREESTGGSGRTIGETPIVDIPSRRRLARQHVRHIANISSCC